MCNHIASFVLHFLLPAVDHSEAEKNVPDGARYTSYSLLSTCFVEDLIHGAPVGKPVSNRCSVTLNYKEDDGHMRSFSRSVTNAGSEFRVDGKVGEVSPSLSFHCFITFTSHYIASSFYFVLFNLLSFLS